MKKIFLSVLISGATFMLFAILSSAFQSCKKPDPPINDTTKVYKPNIYIYPESKMSLKIKVSFPKGGKIVNSIPVYDSVWNVNVETTGKINNKYNYLFYESQQPDEWQYKTGWVIAKDSLTVFFQENMKAYGFNQREIKDFVDFWVPKLNMNKYFLIYPQEKATIDNLIKIDFSKIPDKFLRLFYAIKGTNEIVPINRHSIDKNFKREKFCATEWGVILK